MQSVRKINQFHSGTSSGDAITNDMLEIRNFLRNGGYQSDIFAESVAPELESEIFSIDQYSGDSSAILLVHHSMGVNCFDKVVSLPDRKILRYHNITPPDYLPNEHLRAYAHKGRIQLRDYLGKVEFAIGDSAFNCRELREVGYRDTTVIPIFFNPQALLQQHPSASILTKWANTFNLLFVGRVCPNKKQEDLIWFFDQYFKQRQDSHLILAGAWQGSEKYIEYLRNEIAARGLERAVTLTGKIPQSELAAYYRASSVFICASEHEGFCVPLLEAMSFDLPVVAYHSTAVPEIVQDAGLLLDEKDPRVWAEVIDELRSKPDVRNRVIERQRKRMKSFDLLATGNRLLELIEQRMNNPRVSSVRPTLQVQGPFETSYSLAIVNRSLAIALDEEASFDVSIHCMEGPGDYQPEEKNLIDKPKAAELWQKSRIVNSAPDIVIRNLYPPRVHDIPGKINFLYFAWEDSLIPKEWAEDFNHSLDAVLATSRHVEAVLRDSGVSIPIYLLHEGVDDRFLHFDQVKPAPVSKKSFTFLHISSGFPRKGVDALLKAYFLEFSANDDVCLLIKTFPNIHNDVAAQLAQWKASKPNAPECIHIDRELPEQELEQLYKAAACLVYPTRAEGFGLPIAEAMARRIPVIVTSYSGHMDFCSQDNAFLVNYQLVPSKSHLNVPGAQWAEPDVNHLRQQMRLVFENRGSDTVKRKAETAYQNIKENFRWDLTASRFKEILAHHSGNGSKAKKCLAMVTSWDARCGIAEYSRYLLEAVLAHNSDIEPLILSSPGEDIWQNHYIPHEVCWRNRGEGNLAQVRQILLSSGIDVVHLQFNFGFFELSDLGRTIQEVKQSGKRIIITLHSTADVQANGTLISLRQISDYLQMADMLLVHTKRDQERLASFGIHENVLVFPHGNLIYPMEDKAKLRQELGVTANPIIGTFGFLLPHKGILELLTAVKQLASVFPNIGLVAQCALHRDEISHKFEAVVRSRIQELELDSRVLLSTEFVAPEEAALFLQLADIIVLPYSRTAESSSAAVRFALGAGRPVITTMQPIFEEVADFTYQVKSNEARELAEGIRCVLKDQRLSAELKEKARSYSEETSWDRVALRHARLIDSLTESRPHDNAMVSSS